MPQPLQPFLHDLVCVLSAPTQAWSAADGDAPPARDGAAGVAGLLHADVRVLGGLELRVDGRPGEHLATRSAGVTTVFTSLLRHVGADLATGAEPRVRLDRVRQVAPGRLLEDLWLSSTLDEPVRVQVELVLTPDATPMDAVMGGRAAVPAAAERGPDGTLGWRAGGIDVEVVAEQASGEVTPDGRVTLRWAVDVPARGEVMVEWWLEALDTAAVVVPPRTPSPLAEPDGGPDHRVQPWLHRSLADLAALRMATQESPDDAFYAAGAPWYLTLFGRDSLWTARMLLPLDLSVARGTLRTLAVRQGRRDDPRTAEQPGKIAHELRRDTYSLGGMVLPPLYYGTIDATPLWVCLLHDAWRAGLDPEDVRGLLPVLEAALGWLTEHGDADGDGFLEYIDASGTGLANQGWKDSSDSVRFADGTVATGPIALCEVQGYAYEAARSGADLLEAFGRPGAERLRGWAEELRRRFREAFWCGEGEGRYPAIALDGRKRRVDSLTSNIGHLLGTGLLDPEEELVVARHVSGSALDSGLGLRTMAATDGGYAPLSYHCGSVWPHDTAIVVDALHRAGLGEHAAGLVEGLLRASVAFDGRLPELWSGEGAPVPYPAACRPQAWSAASAVVVAARLGALGGRRPPRAGVS